MIHHVYLGKYVFILGLNTAELMFLFFVVGCSQLNMETLFSFSAYISYQNTIDFKFRECHAQ